MKKGTALLAFIFSLLVSIQAQAQAIGAQNFYVPYELRFDGYDRPFGDAAVPSPQTYLMRQQPPTTNRVYLASASDDTMSMYLLYDATCISEDRRYYVYWLESISKDTKEPLLCRMGFLYDSQEKLITNLGGFYRQLSSPEDYSKNHEQFAIMVSDHEMAAGRNNELIKLLVTTPRRGTLYHISPGRVREQMFTF